MMKTITVKGIGSISAKPDYITISLSIDAKDKEYEKAMLQASERIESLKTAVKTFGLAESDLKTTSFNVSTDYDNVKDRQGNYQRVFAGYVCAYRLQVSFDFDAKLLAKALSSVASSGAQPELSISFTVKEPAKVTEELLANAATNAKEKAEILCRASGAELGTLVSIDYNWGEINIVSQTRYDMEDCIQPLMAMGKSCAPEIELDDIDLSDTATFVWEIK